MKMGTKRMGLEIGIGTGTKEGWGWGQGREKVWNGIKDGDRDGDGDRDRDGDEDRDGDRDRQVAPPWSPPYLRQPPAQVVLPVILRRGLGDEDPVGATGQGGDESQVAAGAGKEAVWGIFPIFHRDPAPGGSVGTYPQCRPITSSTNVRWWLRETRGQVTPRGRRGDVGTGSGPSPCHLWAVVVMASTISMMRCSAESVPMVMSVPQKSLSMEPTMPTMFR